MEGREILNEIERDSKSHAQRRRHMGVLFNRSKVPLLTQMMLEELSNFQNLLAKLSRGAVDLVPTCRALEADIVCKLQSCGSGLYILMIQKARFAFGSSIGAIDSLIDGEELKVVKENDLKSLKMPLVRPMPRNTYRTVHRAYGNDLAHTSLFHDGGIWPRDWSCVLVYWLAVFFIAQHRGIRKGVYPTIYS